ncbi:TOB3 (member of AAA-ATPase family) [Fusarium beomiforme]|uniref:TOB3 (Member of AAA-ATPase family) n=1 Tax=Fusarium beomiforme TaxID=44412 RepID=A0A9P5E152_9HYPO|nr:TOB3 (member of AAA-ATPase family) [Fusarium beomiforme]
MDSPTRSVSPGPKNRKDKGDGKDDSEEEDIHKQLSRLLRREGSMFARPAMLAIPRRPRPVTSNARTGSPPRKAPKGRIPPPPPPVVLPRNPRNSRPLPIPPPPPPPMERSHALPSQFQANETFLQSNTSPPPPPPPQEYTTLPPEPPRSPMQLVIKPPQTHYTISEDAIGASNRDKLAAIDNGPIAPNGFLKPSVGNYVLPSPVPVPVQWRSPSSTRSYRIPTFTKANKDQSETQPKPLELDSVAMGTAGHQLQPDTSTFEETNDFHVLSQVQEETEDSFDTTKTSISTNQILVDENMLQALMQRVGELEQENITLRQDADNSSTATIELPPKVQLFYCLERVEPDDDSMDERSRTVYLSPPEWVVFGDDVDLRGRFPITDPGDYAEEQGASLIVYQYYSVEHQYDAVNAAKRAKQPLPEPEPASQDVVLVTEEMVEAVEALFEQFPSFSDDFPYVYEMGSLKDPHLWWYHCRTSFKIEALSERHAQLVGLLIDWIENNFAPLYDQIDDQFKRGKVSSDSIEFLMRPGDTLVAEKNGKYSGRVATTRPTPYKEKKKTEDSDKDPEKQWTHSWLVETRSYGYAGKFFAVDKELIIEFPPKYRGGEINITDLNVIPLSYAKPKVKELLRQRGKRFWKLREKTLISYEGSDSDRIQAGQRFMVDFDTYKELHPGSSYMRQEGYMSMRKPNLPKDGSEPEEPEIYLFPKLIPGFDLRRKKWVDLEVDRIRDVSWNKEAFKSLVADEAMKELVLALVTNQLDAEKNTDLIESKGSGLIMLLHGSPGTGKTFTAESVAEIAKKPLYPVTCGDIGTEPADVEKYLESVFHLGKVWDCVVLLDEAEVFLEQRTLQDLKRNALVSVFLRALEYYEGILILTTNRVGTFDEAFKSRIQLALRYEKLKDYQRKQIWKNFLARLKSLGEEESIDFDDIELYLEELAKYPMNGRQIRNSITTGRQLAKYKRKKMTFAHLKRAIDVADKFDRYLADVQEGDMEEFSGRGESGRYTPEYLARADQIR